MKKLFHPLLPALVIFLISCNNDPSSTKEENPKMSQYSAIAMDTGVDKEIKTVAVTFPNVDPSVTSYMKAMLENYLDIKNALANRNQPAAATASSMMKEQIKKFDKSLLSAEQKKVYDMVEDDLKEHAAQISGSKIDQQRQHFSLMSKDVYELVKAFGPGITLYHDHCPMYNENEGAMWLSETKEINNPYMGDKMMDCGTVEEMFQ